MNEKEKILFLKHQALMLRIDSIRATTQAESGHPTSCLSAADIISVIFFNFLRYDIKDRTNVNNDRFILSKGHAAPVMYAAWKLLGVINDEKLMNLRKFDSPLEGHPTPRFIYNEVATGSLGQGLSIGLGMAINAQIDKLNYKTYVLMGDGEISEGSIWEAAELAAYYKVDNLIGIVDCNRLGQTGQTLHGHHTQAYVDKFQAFGWKSIAIDGHNIQQIIDAINTAHTTKNQPTMIIAQTKKGYGLNNKIEDAIGWHGKPLKKEDAEKAILHLKTTFKEEYDYNPEVTYKPPSPSKISINSSRKNINLIDLTNDPNKKYFEKGNKLATRKAFGYALASLGRKNNQIIALDADVKNSTFSEIFEKDCPNRLIQCFIAEQNMIGIAIGLQTRGKIPFASTFGSFLTRAFDQLRMAGIGKNALRICGSHCGVSIGQDGPSQMGLEDIAMFNTIPNSTILYPSDAVSTYKLINLCTQYEDGISYLRTTRSETPIIYDQNENFEIGGCKIIQQSEKDQCCIITAGITLHEAIKAHEKLKDEDIFTAVIDIYSVKPLDIKTITKIANKSKNKILSVEDHYLNGGIGQILASQIINSGIKQKILAVTQIPRSGTPEELMQEAKIDAQSIVNTVKNMI